MRILDACIFVSFLAGKLKKIKQMLLTAKENLKKTAHAYFKRPYFF